MDVDPREPINIGVLNYVDQHAYALLPEARTVWRSLAFFSDGHGEWRTSAGAGRNVYEQISSQLGVSVPVLTMTLVELLARGHIAIGLRGNWLTVRFKSLPLL